VDNDIFNKSQYINEKVKLSRYGEGIIIDYKIEDNKLFFIIEFECGIKKIDFLHVLFNDSFKFCNENKMDAIKAYCINLENDIKIEKDIKLKEQKEKELQLRKGRIEPKIKTLEFGKHFDSHHDILNNCFSTSYKCYRRGFYQVDNLIGVWFPKESIYYDDLFLPVNKNGWINIWNEKGILEKNYIKEYKNNYEDLERLVFIKALNKNNKYYPGYFYIGVFSLSAVLSTGIYNRHFVRVADKFNLLTMEPEYFGK